MPENANGIKTVKAGTKARAPRLCTTLLGVSLIRGLEIILTPFFFHSEGRGVGESRGGREYPFRQGKGLGKMADIGVGTIEAAH